MESDALARIDENVKYLRQSADKQEKALAEHILEDKKIVADYIKPLWEERQQNIGAARARGIGGLMLDKVATVGAALIGAWAVMRGLK